MKIIEALKKIKDLQRKADDIRKKISSCCAIMSFESPKYKDQDVKICGWLQSHHDIVLEIEGLRYKIAKTNIETLVTIELGGKHIEKSIHRWLSRRRDLVDLDLGSWRSLTDRGLLDKQITGTSGDILNLKVVRFYNPETRDKNLDELQTEKSLIDGRLEIVNAITDIVE